ncbi:MAG TPA: PilZ domain-containing protein [Kofleriaceae bacterium]|nr:PilZ domain-containing protein [Kofleriaceae bacterium]
MSRRSPRIRARFAATVHIAGVEHTLVCHTRDISAEGCFLDTAEMIAPGVGLSLALMDNERGEVVQVDGVVARCLPGGPNGVGRGVGVRLVVPPPDWQLMVQRYQQSRATEDAALPSVRLAILVVGDEEQRRGALALYVTSGWDVRFATDVDTAEEAMAAVDLDAIIAEYELRDPRWREILSVARRLQPDAHRFVRCTLRGQRAPSGAEELVDRVIDREAGLDALVEALGAAFGSDRATR